ncbi:MAG: hypothetical protein A3J79_02805 [Elusimicrobia bacterium RIFOXYB2_FULL_62_6]|nr:MAG: hypothetical protein A3J79_02805 [Elusimicrobia bacterium RIFOXYB2_FULL_62_6]
MQWSLQECGSGFRAQKADGLTAFIRRACLWAEMKPGRGLGYDITYKGFAIARISFARRGALVKPFAAAQSFPEISDLDLVELALRVSKYREAAAAALN